MSNPHVIFGCASIGASFPTKEDVRDVLETLQKAAITRLDTAARYPPTSPGLSEKLLGETHIAQHGFLVDTKIACSADPSGSLAEAAIGKSLNQSLLSLDVSKVIVASIRDETRTEANQSRSMSFIAMHPTNRRLYLNRRQLSTSITRKASSTM